MEFLLDLFRDVTRDDLGLQVVDISRFDHDTDLTTRLHRERLHDTGMTRADLLETLQPLHVRFEGFPASTGPSAADVVGDLREHRVDRVLLDLAMVGFDAVDDLGALAQSTGDSPRR